MIVIQVSMWPGGNPNKAYHLGRAFICNMGQHEDPKKGDYVVAVRPKKSPGIKDGKPWNGALRVGEVKNYPRLSYNMWRLIIRGLLAAFPEEKK